MNTYFIVTRGEGSIQMLYLENDLSAMTWCKEQYGPLWTTKYTLYIGSSVAKGA